MEECKAFIKFIESLPLELTPPKKRGEAERVNREFGLGPRLFIMFMEYQGLTLRLKDRISITSPEFAQTLHDVLLPHLPTFPYPASTRRNNTSERLPHSLNTNIRMYKYTAGQYFGPHYDDSVRDSVTGAKSEWTLLIYLSGAEDGVQGGEVPFNAFSFRHCCSIIHS